MAAVTETFNSSKAALGQLAEPHSHACDWRNGATYYRGDLGALRGALGLSTVLENLCGQTEEERRVGDGGSETWML